MKELVKRIHLMLVRAFGDDERHAYEIITPITAEMIVSESTYNNLYTTFYSISRKEYGEVSMLLQKCLKEDLNGKDIQRMLNLVLQKYPDLLSAINQVIQNNMDQTIGPEKMLVLFRILESKARMKYHEYTLKLNSMMSLFFFYVFLVPTPIMLASGLLPENSYLLLSAFFISSMIVFKIFFNKIGRIRSALLG